MPDVELVLWPFHAGIADVGMGTGATRLAHDRGFLEAVAPAGGSVRVSRVPAIEADMTEVARVFELDRRLAAGVAEVRGRGARPLVLGGNCVSCLGTTAGVRQGAADEPLGVVWLDAHADLDTPEDTLAGFTDAMGLAILTGGCWRALRETIPGFRTVAEQDVVLVGTRGLEPHQRERLERSDVRVVPGAVAAGAEGALDELRHRVERVYLHVDLDVLDVSVGRANPHASAGGPDLETVLAVVRAAFARFDVAAVALTAYDASTDEDGSVAAAATAIAAQIAVLCS